MSNKEKDDRALISAIAASSMQPSVPGNQYFVSELSVCNLQLSPNELVVLSHSSVAADDCVTASLATHATIATLEQAFTATNVKI